MTRVSEEVKITLSRPVSLLTLAVSRPFIYSPFVRIVRPAKVFYSVSADIDFVRHRPQSTVSQNAPNRLRFALQISRYPLYLA